MKPGAEAAAATLLVAYDCPSTREGERRRRAFRKLLSALERIQYSVYFGALPRPALPALESGLNAAIEVERDRLLIVDVGAGTWRQLGLGMPAVRLPPAALVILARGAPPPRTQRDPAFMCKDTDEAPLVAEAPAADSTGTCERAGRAIDQAIGFGRWLFGER